MIIDSLNLENKICKTRESYNRALIPLILGQGARYNDKEE